MVVCDFCNQGIQYKSMQHILGECEECLIVFCDVHRKTQLGIYRKKQVQEWRCKKCQNL